MNKLYGFIFTLFYDILQLIDVFIIKMQEKDRNEIFNTLLRTFPLPRNLENFSLRNKNILLKCLFANFSPENITRCCIEIQKHFHKEKDGKIIFEICYKNICDLLFKYADEYYSTLDKIIYSAEFGPLFKLMDHGIFDTKYQDILRTIWLNFITAILNYSITNSFEVYISTSFKDLLNKHIDSYYDCKRLQLYKIDLEETCNILKAKISKELDIWDHRIQEKYLLSNEDESLIIS
ncbi:MAG: hypothetical protein RLZZ418_268, partial [Pseudomonadota bacterium]